MTAPAPRLTAIGVDPGPVPGVAIVRPDGSTSVLQCSAGLLDVVLRAVVETCELHSSGGFLAVIACERYVVGPRSGRTSSPKANEQTRQMAGAVEGLAAELGVPCRMRSANEVKAWAQAGSPSRLARAGLEVDGMRHARSAGWHALYAHVHDCGGIDPLSRRARSS